MQRDKKASLMASKQAESTASAPQVPGSLRVCLVDDDRLCLRIVERMLRRCNYEVATCARASDALQRLREERFDLVLSDVYMPDMDGLRLLELVNFSLHLPVIMMSACGDTSVVVQGIAHGAVDYLLKPIRIEELRTIWQHTVRRELSHSAHPRGSSDDDSAYRSSLSGPQPPETSLHPPHLHLPDPSHSQQSHAAAGARDTAAASPVTDASTRAHETGSAATRGDPNSNHQLEEHTSATSNKKVGSKKSSGKGSRKSRVVWSVELHQLFVKAVHELGVDKAVPKRVLEKMGVEGLTRENVASHLQKYRLYLKRLQEKGDSEQQAQSMQQKRNSDRFEPAEPPKAPTHQEVATAEQQHRAVPTASLSNVSVLPSHGNLQTSESDQADARAAEHVNPSNPSPFTSCELDARRWNTDWIISPSQQEQQNHAIEHDLDGQPAHPVTSPTLTCVPNPDGDPTMLVDDSMATVDASQPRIPPQANGCEIASPSLNAAEANMNASERQSAATNALADTPMPVTLPPFDDSEPAPAQPSQIELPTRWPSFTSDGGYVYHLL